MKRWSLCAALLLSLLQARAFDPIGPPPVWTLPKTCAYIAKTIRPQIQFAVATAPEVLEFLMIDRPRPYFPEYELDEVLAKSDQTFEMDRKDATDLEILAWLAEQLGAELLIKPGKVRLQK